MSYLFNAQMVGVQGKNIIVLKPASLMTKEEALVHAAWIVTLADDEDKFQKVLNAVQKI